ncbi:hypothetical protein [Oceanobacillus rekensis]|nr:hypothetical protein [Oceanobacillus rekensis]
MRYIAYIFALFAGVALSFEGAIYDELGKTTGNYNRRLLMKYC